MLETLLSIETFFILADIKASFDGLRALIMTIAAILCLGALIVGALSFMRGEIATGLYALIGAGVLAAGWLIVQYLFESSESGTILF